MKISCKIFHYLQHTHMCALWIRALPPAAPICMVMCSNEILCFIIVIYCQTEFKTMDVGAGIVDDVRYRMSASNFEFVWALDLCLINRNESSRHPAVA